jgi:hypothetical protein
MCRQWYFPGANLVNWQQPILSPELYFSIFLSWTWTILFKWRRESEFQLGPKWRSKKCSHWHFSGVNSILFYRLVPLADRTWTLKLEMWPFNEKYNFIWWNHICWPAKEENRYASPPGFCDDEGEVGFTQDQDWGPNHICWPTNLKKS